MGSRWLEAVRNNRPAVIGGGIVALGGIAVSLLVGLEPLLILGLLVASGLAAWGVYGWRTRHLDPPPRWAPGRSLASIALLATVVVFLAAQAVPYGRNHTNPRITSEPAWDSPMTRELVARACFDCHSNESEWPWYSNIAPVSWLLWSHVTEGRGKVNYSEWDKPQREADKSFRTVKDGSMPPTSYTLGGLHSDAKLSDAEMAALLEGLQATPGLSE